MYAMEKEKKGYIFSNTTILNEIKKYNLLRTKLKTELVNFT